MPSRSLASVAAYSVAVLTFGCGAADSSPSEPNPVASISLSPASALVEPGRSLRLSPTLRDARRLVVTGRDLVWASSDSLVATVTAGLVTGVREGFALITASADESHATASITVRRAVSVVQITPEEPTVAVGRSVQLHATVIGENGRPVEGLVVSWSTSNPGVASVDVGKVGGVRAGSAEITAMAGDKRATTPVTVVPDAPGPLTPATAPGARHVGFPAPSESR